MYKVTDEQVDFIADEIRKRGITLDDLLWNLVDHVCCIIEQEMSEADDFHRFLQALWPRFFKDNLREIQEEAELLITFKHFYAMKRTLSIAGITSAIFTLTGSILKIAHLPGAGIAIVLGVAIFALLFLPLMIILKFRDETTKSDRLVFALGFLLGIAASLGFLFKIMHWPFANVLMLTGIVGFTFAYVPLYLITRIRRPELRFNTMVNAVLMFSAGGLLFAMFNLHRSTKMNVALDQSSVLLLRLSEEKPIVWDKPADSTSFQELTTEIDLLRTKVQELEDLGFELAGVDPGTTEASREQAMQTFPLDSHIGLFATPKLYNDWKQLVASVNRTEQKLQKLAAGYTPLDLNQLNVEHLGQRQFFQNLWVIKSHYQIVKLQLK
ncbi:MAG: hypothetical protein ACOVO3_05685 [Fluviicola sp.]|jgi:hypothetical protein